MDGMESIKQTFFLECEDLLSELESGLIELNDGGGDTETVNAVFRAVHSIKGGAGAFNLTDLVSFAHIFENVLDDVRSERLESTPEVLTLLLQSSDMLNDLVSAARDDTGYDATRYAELLDKLTKFNEQSGAEGGSNGPDAPTMSEDFGFEPMAMDFSFDDPIEPADNTKTYDIVFKPRHHLFVHGNSATRLINNLGKLGEMNVSCDMSALPHFEDIDPEEAYIFWNIELHTDKSKSDIDEVFEFAIDDCDLIISERISETANPTNEAPIQNALEAFGLPDLSDLPPLNTETPLPPVEVANLASPAPTIDPSQDIADILAGVTPVQPTSAPVTPAPAPKPVQPVASTAKPSKASPKTVETQKKDKPAPKAAPPATIRINLERVDRLINLVGELVINQAMLSECVMDAGIAGDPSVLSGLDEFKQLTRDIQESVMAIRAQPVQPLFQRMSRIVREAAQATSKSAKLVMEGEFTEVDKTIVEKLADPLTHMIRNAIDHGLETPEDRLAKGKPAEGTIKLSAAHRSGKIVIEVSDDGAGINRKRVKQIAIDKGLISEETQLTDTEIDNLLFMAGFSTVDKVSTLSGRGVGMDVVKRAIQSIGGRITISSQPDKGSTFTINLPLTLAVLDGMLVQVADQTIVVPLTAIVETLLPNPKEIHTVSPGCQVMNVRGTFIPLLDLGKALNFRSNDTDNRRGVVLCIETEDGTKCAIAVDNIQDQRQVVIKSLEDNYGDVPCIAAATILGDGRIALILDPDELVLRSSSQAAPMPAAAPQIMEAVNV